MMFSFLKPNPLKNYRKQYAELLEQAMQAQRRGDIRGYSTLTERAEEVAARIEELEKQAQPKGA